MQSDVTIHYKLDYKVTYDAEIAKRELADLWDEAEHDESLFAEYMEDAIIASLEEFEGQKNAGVGLPRYITHFSLEESTS